MTRHADWQARLTDWLTQEAVMPFCEADRHCGWFVADAVLFMTGTDFAAEWRGRHKTIGGALRALQKVGVSDHVDLVSRCLPEVAAAFAQRGDVVVVCVDGQLVLGILQGEKIYVRGRSGIVMLDRMSALRAFSVA